MKYKMVFDGGNIKLVGDEGNDLVFIFWRDALKNNYPDWPEGFWYCPDWCLNSSRAKRGIAKWYREANVDYHEHRDEYIMEAKKLMVKSML